MIELEACAHVVPLMAPETVVEVARQAERIGYHHCLVADEGFHPDVHTCLGMIARETTRMRLGFSANPYTRHPAVTAAAAATLDRLSGGRAFVTLLTGGSMVLGPMGLERHRPRVTLDDALQVMRLLWTGDEVTHHGPVFSLDRARLAVAPCQAHVWVAGRGPGVLGVAGRHADLALCTVKPDLAGAFAVVDEAARGRPAPPRRAYLGRICFTEEMLEDQAATLPFVLLDSPRRVLEAIGFDEEEIALVERAAADNRP
ncbi:MAG: LLM class flavin-dependent oxidoreductase, partial [Actinomyces sp.]